MKNISLFEGQELLTLTKETVIIKKIENEFIYLEYKKKIYKRRKSIIGKKLFIINKQYSQNTASQKPLNDSDIPSYTCKNCMEMRKGECFGKSEICEFFRYAPTISKDEINNWPKYGDATYYRMISKK